MPVLADRGKPWAMMIGALNAGPVSVNGYVAGDEMKKFAAVVNEDV